MSISASTPARLLQALVEYMGINNHAHKLIDGLFVWKLNGSLCPSVDFRALNNTTIKK